jgi:hypothetical protein
LLSLQNSKYTNWNYSMRIVKPLITLCVVGSLLGCDSQQVVESTVPATAELHGGILVPLAESENYVELLNGKSVKKGKALETDLVAYVLKGDRKSPVSELPPSIEVRIDTPKGTQVVPLKSAPDSSDPAGSSRFVSAPGPFQLNQTGGEVTLQVNGKSLTASFRGPR